HHEYICGEVSTILENPVEIPFATPVTIAAQQTAPLYFEFDFPENLAQRFKISLQDSSYINASSSLPLTIVNEYRNSHGMINIESHSPVIVPPTLKQAFGNYPNPFGSSGKEVTHFVYYLTQNTDLQLRIFTLLGELVWKCAYRASDPQGKKGLHQSQDIVWNGKNLKGHTVLNGVYVAIIQTTDGNSATAKIAVLK
ncbi:hypothetical protein L0Z72_16430, partial [candidate division KSB1 bacterium]|nr:hypothetical protein [candidate division KSB1 bacterium]